MPKEIQESAEEIEIVEEIEIAEEIEIVEEIEIAEEIEIVPEILKVQICNASILTRDLKLVSIKVPF